MDESLPLRLREQRKHLGLTQQGAAEAAGVKRETWNRYESGELTPGLDALQGFAAAGADVLYILTGQRAAPVAREQPAGYSVEVLSPEEQALLDNYRHAPEDAQRAIRQVGATLAQPSVKAGRKRG